MAESRELQNLPTADYRSESAVGDVEMRVDPRLLCMAVAFGVLGCIDGAQNTQADRAEDSPHSIVYQPEKTGEGVFVNAVVVKGNAIDVFLGVPEGYEGEQRSASVSLLRDGSVVESGLREVLPGENPFSFVFGAAIEPGDQVEVALDGAPTFVVTVGKAALGREEMPEMPR